MTRENRDKFTYVEGEVTAISDDAVCIKPEGHYNGMWIPKSLIEDSCTDPDEIRYRDHVEIAIPNWLAEEKGI